MKKLLFVWALSLTAIFLGAQESIVNFDQARSDSVFVDAGGGVKESSFLVTGNLQTLVFMVAFQTGNPELELVSPAGTSFDLSSPRLKVQRLVWGFIVSLSTPELGTWKLRLLHTLGEGSYLLKSIQVPAQPTISLQTPALIGEPWSSSVSVRGSTQIDQAGKSVRVMIATSKDDMTGVIAGQSTVASDGSFQVSLDPADVAGGEYYVVAALEAQADLPSIKTKASGTLVRPTPALLSAVNSVVFVTEVPGVLNVSFANPFAARSATFRVHVNSLSGAQESIDIGSQTQARLTGFPLGDADVWLTAVDSLGREGQPSTVQRVTFAPAPPALPTLSLSSSNLQVNVTAGSDAVAFELSLAGSFSSQGPQSDWVETALGSPLTAGLNVKNDQNTYFLPTQSGHLTFHAWANADLAPGSYPIPIVIKSVAGDQNAVTATVTVVVSAPAVALTSVSPSSWAGGTVAPLEILGSNFLAGTRVFLDDVELPVDAWSLDKLAVTAPSSISAGPHQLRVVGKNQTQASLPVVVRAPSYAILAFKSFTKALAGTHARFWLGVSALSGFTGAANFQIVGLPASWSAQVTPSYVSDGQTAVVDVTIPASAAAGTSKFFAQTSEGGSVELTVEIPSAPIDPFISSLTSYGELAGASFQIRGFGFGSTQASVEVDTVPWPVSAWKDDEITVTVPSGAQTGLLRVKLADGRISNGITFGVKDYGFQFHVPGTLFEVQGGDTRSFDVQLTGYKQAVELSVQSSSPYISASLSSTSVLPVGVSTLNVVVDKNIPVGTYDLQISGTSGVYQASQSISLHVGKALEWTTASLPSAMEATPYALQLASTGAQGAATYALEEGVFPQGISMNSSGLISGRALQRGLFRVVLSVSDTVGHKTIKEFALTVEESGWTSVAHDEGSSLFAAVPSPADARKLWTSAPVGSVGAGVTILGAGGNVFVLAQDGVVCLFAQTGKILYRIPGAFQNLRYQSGKLFALDSSGVFHAWESGFGNELYSREGVQTYALLASSALVQSGTSVLTLDLNSGTLSQTLSADLSGNLTVFQGNLYRAQGSTIQSWSASGWTTVVSTPAPGSSGNYTSIQADSESLILTTSAGNLVSWSPQGLALVATAAGVQSVVLKAQQLVVRSSNSIQILSRSSGGILKTFPIAAQSIFAANEKLFAVQNQTLLALNLERGSTIWQTPALGAILYGDRLYALEPSFTVSAFNAPDNVSPPTTSLVTTPAAPDGQNGWFVTSPQISLAATDPETFAASTQIKIDSGDSAPYSTSFQLADGIHSLVFSSRDSGNLVEADRMTSVKIDSLAPVTVLQTSPASLPGLPVWGSSVTLTLSATDSTSGLAATEYRLSPSAAWQAYSQPVTVSAEGAYNLEYRSRDTAGNIETAHSLSFFVDFADPTVSANVVHGSGIETLVLTASDSGSGVDRIEYKLGQSGSVSPYTQPVVFTTSGHWDVFFRAFDKAGRSSPWGSVSVDNNAPSSASVIDKIEYTAALKNRSVDQSVQIGNPLFLGSNAKFQNLPAGLVGAAYLRGRDTDAQSNAANYIQITFKESALVTMLVEPASKTNLSGWSKGATLAAGSINSSYFAGGLVTYTRSVTSGEKLTITGPALTKTGGDLIFVQSQWNGVSVILPAEGSTFSAGDTVSLAAVSGPAVQNILWSVRENAGPWKNIGSGASATYTVSQDADAGKLDVRAQATAFGQSVTDVKTYTILPPPKLKIRYPDEEDRVSAGTPVSPVVIVKQNRKRNLVSSQVQWTVVQNGQNVFQGAAPFTIAKAGEYTLTARYTWNNGKVLTQTSKLRVVADWPVRSHRWSELLSRLRDDEDDGFETRPITLPLPAGTWEVSVTVGKLKAWDVATVQVENQAVNVSAKKDGQFVKLRFVVQSGDGGIVVKSTKEIPWYSLNYRKLEDGTPVSANIVATSDKAED